MSILVGESLFLPSIRPCSVNRGSHKFLLSQQLQMSTDSHNLLKRMQSVSLSEVQGQDLEGPAKTWDTAEFIGLLVQAGSPPLPPLQHRTRHHPLADPLATL